MSTKRVQTDDVYGEEYVTKFGNTISVGFTPEINKSGISQFTATCNICSLDKELWPTGSIKVTIRNIRNKVASCGCSSTCRYTDSQRRIQIDRLCEGTGWILKGFDKYPIVSNKTRAILYDPSSDITRYSLVCNLIKNGVKDYVKGSVLDIKSIQDDFDKYKHLYPAGTCVVRNMDDSRKTVLVSCPSCGDKRVPIRPEAYRLGSRGCRCKAGGWGYFTNRSGQEDTLYLLKFSYQGEVFYKVGRSFNVKERIRAMYKQHKRYEVTVLSSKVDKHADIFNLESELHVYLYKNGHSYRPKHFFHGAVYECFTKDILTCSLIKDTFGV